MSGRFLGGITVPGTPDEVAGARRHVRDLLARSGLDCSADDAELLTSECVTNAMRFTLSGAEGGKVTVNALHLGGAVRIEIVDEGGAATAPVPRGAPDSDTAVNGRGLHLVEALAKEWGKSPYGEGTMTWFVL